MRITYAPGPDAAYIYLTGEPLQPGRVTIHCDLPDEIPYEWVAMDWKDGKIVGLEVLDASSLLHPDLLAQADSQPVRIIYAPGPDAAYIYLTGEPLQPGRVSIPCGFPAGVFTQVLMDWKDGKIVGLEVPDASSLLHADLLAQAERPGTSQEGASPPET